MNFALLFERIVGVGKKRLRNITAKARLERKISRLVESNCHNEALEVLAAYARRSPKFPGLGKQVRKLLTLIHPERKNEFHQKVESNILYIFEDNYTALYRIENVLTNYFHILAGLGYWEKIYDIALKTQNDSRKYREIPALWEKANRVLLEKSLRAGDAATAAIHLENLCKDAEDISPYGRYARELVWLTLKETQDVDFAVHLLKRFCRSPRDYSFYGSSAAGIARTAVSKAHAVGQLRAEELAPLLNPKIFQDFLARRSGDTLLSRMNSQVLQWLHEVQKPRTAPVSPAQGRKLRALIVSEDTWHFIRPAAIYFEKHGIEVRYLPFARCRAAIDEQNKRDNSRPVFNAMLFALGFYQLSAEEANRAPWAAELIDWCDVVFVEWWSAPAVWFSRYLAPEKTLIVRCHSYEAFNPLTHFTNMRGVDGAIFIADHIRQIFNAVYADLPVSEQKQVVISNIRNRNHLIGVEKQDNAPFTLGMMQYATINKDPLFALDILEELVRADDRWTLNLVGNSWGEARNEEERAYQAEFERRVSTLSRHVVIEPFTNDPAAWHARIGFVVSTSHREGSHESVMDGMVTGSVPVIRRWPMVKDFGAPVSAFPGVPAFETPQEAANYILKCKDDFDTMSRRMREHAIAIYDPDISGEQLVKFVSECAKNKCAV